jgi:predicted  nucleic acid-binding Zn-ribbon protein
MGVITCVECGTGVNDAVARCPQCGADPRTGFTAEERAETERRRPLEPVEQARQARDRGQRFLEIVLRFDDHEVIAMRTGRRDRSAESSAAGRAEQLSAIEAEGWELVASDYVASDLRYEREPLAVVEGGPVEATALVGIYLFRAALEEDIDAVEAGPEG